MPFATIKHPEERFDHLFRRFKKAVEKDDTLKTIQSKEFYEKPSAKRKRNKAAAKKRAYRDRMEKTVIKKRMY